MGTYTRVGSYLLASELASDPFGAIHRAVVISGSAFERHVLVRTFTEELFQAGIGTRLAEAGRVVPLLGAARVFGLGYRIESGKAPHVVWDYVPGRSLAQLIDKAKQEQIPFGVDHALTVIQGVAQGIVQMQAKGISHGVLSPHSVWVSFEGSTQLVDAPFASVARSLMAKAPTAKHKLAAYMQGADSDPLQHDLFALGALLYELLTFERLPVGGNFQSLLEQATLKAAQEDGPLPAEIRAFLGRLLLGRQPFTSMEAFNTELERVLYDGEYSPTTFNMAFFMHTLFREENDRDATAMKAEQGDNYLAYTAAGETMRSGATRIDGVPDQTGEPAGQKNTTLLIGGGLAAVVILGLGYIFFGRTKVDPAIQAQLLEFKQIKAEMEKQKAELDAKAKAEAEKTTQLQKQLTEAKSTEDKGRIQKQLEEAAQRKVELERQQKAAEQRLLEQKQSEQRLAEQRKAAEPKETTVSAPPPNAAPQPAPEPPKPVAMPSAAPRPAQAETEPARLVSQVPLAFPQRAVQMRWELDKEHIVRLKVFVGEQGQALKVSITQGVEGTYGFDESAVESAYKSVYTPAMRDGKPVRGWTPEIVYKFPKRR
ncbi:MAG: energy transducer TonB [Holophagaceae bacterium]|uniref:Energy transducer TonB n=1 Tax=Candidatus Geothrix skivensis TaxID=2954439 RepID=A0A9D7SEW3_9BACT|nr:energy transducer TonB [Candidatus Geothrix skivensis]